MRHTYSETQLARWWPSLVRRASPRIPPVKLSLISPLPPTDRGADDHHEGNERDQDHRTEIVELVAVASSIGVAAMAGSDLLPKR
jgi:hypothetical protein